MTVSSASRTGEASTGSVGSSPTRSPVPGGGSSWRRRTPPVDPPPGRGATSIANVPRWRFIGALAAVVILAAGTVALTLAAARLARHDAATTQANELDRVASALTSTLQATLLRADDAAAFLGGAPVDAAHWQVAQYRLFADPALFGAGQALAFPDSQRHSVEQRLGAVLREPGAGGTLVPARRYASYVVPVYVAYRDGGHAGLGVDLAAEPQRLATFRRAAELGRGQLTAPVPLVGTTNQDIVVVYSPVHAGKPPGGPADVTGYVIASYRAAGLVERARTVIGPRIRFRLADNGTTYDDTAGKLTHPRSRTLPIGGRNLNVTVARPPADYSAAIAVAATGTLINIVVALLLRTAMRSEQRALADREALRVSERRLAAQTLELQARAEDRARLAREANDAIVQGLVATEAAYDLGHDEHARELLRSASRQARDWVGDLIIDAGGLQPGRARRGSEPRLAGEERP